MNIIKYIITKYNKLLKLVEYTIPENSVKNENTKNNIIVSPLKINLFLIIVIVVSMTVNASDIYMEQLGCLSMFTFESKQKYNIKIKSII